MRKEKGRSEMLPSAPASSLAIVVRRSDGARCGYEAGADPRREGVALGR
jgi:gamma-glutamyltranspeptidase